MTETEEYKDMYMVIWNPDESVKIVLPFWNEKEDRIQQLYPHMTEGDTWSLLKR